LEKGPCGIVLTIAPSRKTRCDGKWLPVSLVVTLTVGPLQSSVPWMECQMNQDKRGQTAWNPGSTGLAGRPFTIQEKLKVLGPVRVSELEITVIAGG